MIVSNRLPIIIEKADGRLKARPASGGLVSAMKVVLNRRGGLWVGWPGVAGEKNWDSTLDGAAGDLGFKLRSVALNQSEIDGFYSGFSNQVIWPLFHDLQTRCNFALDFWRYYLSVNHKFAQTIFRMRRGSDIIWVHDYHLIHLARMLRPMGVGKRIVFFLHIPFPTPEIFVKLPWRGDILQALLEYELIGFQTLRDRRNFQHCLQFLLKDVKIEGRGAVVTARIGTRKVRLGAFPIGIDYRAFARRAVNRDILARALWLQDAMGSSQIILGVDRLDYTKGLPERLRVFNHALQRYPELLKRVTLVQVVVPSRTMVPEYQALKAEIEQLVGEVNGRFTHDGWVPIHYIYRSLDRDELIAHYRAADIGMITPLKDGMNLVAKEFCACCVKEDGVLILSEFAGAAAQLYRGALLVNPYDIRGASEAIYNAFRMPRDERRRRMRLMRDNIRRQDVSWWADTFLSATEPKRDDQVPVPPEYVPRIEQEFGTARR